MEPNARAITWEAPEHYHVKRGGDWYFILTIFIISLSVASLLLGNTLFALLIFVSGGTIALATLRHPSIVPFSVSVRGVRVDDVLYPFTTLAAYHIDEEDSRGPQLLLMTKKRFTPIIVVPIPHDYIDEVEDIVLGRLEEKDIEVPTLVKLVEYFGL